MGAIRGLALATLLAFAPEAAAQISGHGGGFTATKPTQRSQTPAAARGANRLAPPIPPATDSLGAKVFLYYTVIVILGGVVIAVSVMPGKRGHKD